MGSEWAIECVGIELAIDGIDSETGADTVFPPVEETGGGTSLFGGF